MVSLNTSRINVAADEKHEDGLVLTRREGEAIFYRLPNGEVIEIWVKRVHGNRVAIRSVAPRTIDIKRNELAERAA